MSPGTMKIIYFRTRLPNILIISFFCNEITIESLLVHAEDFYEATIDSLSLYTSSAQTTHRCTFLP